MLTPLKLARLQRGLRQMDVALKLGISPARISFYETGLMLPPKDIKERLVKLLDCPMSELFPERSLGKDEEVKDILEEVDSHGHAEFTNNDHNPSLSAVAADKGTAR